MKNIIHYVTGNVYNDNWGLGIYIYMWEVMLLEQQSRWDVGVGI